MLVTDTAYSNRPDIALPHLTESELAGYLDRDLSERERRRIEEHLDACDDCREEAVGAARLLNKDWEASLPATTEQRPHRRWHIPAGIAGLVAAAALAALILIPPNGLEPGPVSTERDGITMEGVDPLAVYAPPDEQVVEREDLSFAWEDGGTESYRITLTGEDGALVWSHSLADTTLVPPSSLELESGQRFFWYVDAISAGVVARTEPHSFVVAQ